MKDEEAGSFIQNNSSTSKLRNKNSISIVCPYCGTSVTLISFGTGWVGTCCGKVVYNSKRLPVDP